jgi:hypothetical protein
MLRNWRWVAIGGLFLALGFGTGMFLMTPKSYTVTGSYMLLSPVQTVEGKAGNPFLQLGNGVGTLADLLSVSLRDGETSRGYTEQAPQLKYSVARDTSIAAPLILLKVEDATSANAFKVRDSLAGLLAARLDSMQKDAGAPHDLWVTLSPLTSDTRPATDYSSPIRNSALTLLGTLLVTLLLTGILERRRIRRGRRNKPSARGLERSSRNHHLAKSQHTDKPGLKHDDPGSAPARVEALPPLGGIHDASEQGSKTRQARAAGVP